jgi:hypothetical protein
MSLVNNSFMVGDPNSSIPLRFSKPISLSQPARDKVYADIVSRDISSIHESVREYIDSVPPPKQTPTQQMDSLFAKYRKTI